MKTSRLEMEMKDAEEALIHQKEISTRLREGKSQLQVQKRELESRAGVLQEKLEELGESVIISPNAEDGSARSTGSVSPTLTREQQAKAVMDAEREAMQASKKVDDLQTESQRLEQKLSEALEKSEELEEERQRAQKRVEELQELLAKSEAGRKEAEAARLATEEASRERAEEAGRRQAQLQAMELREKEEATLAAENRLAEERQALQHVENQFNTLRAKSLEIEERQQGHEQAMKALELEKEKQRAKHEEQKENVNRAFNRQLEDQQELLRTMEKEIKAVRDEGVLLSMPAEAAKALAEGDAELKDENARLQSQLERTPKLRMLR